MSEDSKDVKASTDANRDGETDKDSSMEDTSHKQDESEVKSESEKENGDDKEAGDDDKEDKDEDEEESDDEPQVGLLEKPLVLEEGKKRERKKVERISFEAAGGGTPQVLEIKEGKGRSLGDIPYIDYKLSRTKAEDLKPLHRLLYRRQGSAAEVKKNIRQFSGFPFPTDDSEYEKRVQMLKGKSYPIAILKLMMDILDIPRSGTKDELVMRLMEWLEKPKDSGKKIPQPKRKKKSKGESEKKSKGKKEKKKTEKKKKESKKKESDDEEESEKEAEGEEEEAEEEEESDVSEEEEEPPKKKARKSSPKATKEKKPKEKKTPSKPATKKKATPQKKEAMEASDVSSDSDDEPLVTKTQAKGPPTNDELKDVIKKMLDNANLEQVTMKTVLKDVFAKYPDFDLTDRKDFIKNTVKQIIS